MTPTEVLKMLKSKIDVAELNKYNYVIETSDIEAISQALLLYDVSDRTSSNNRLKIEPVYDGISTAVTQYKITDDLGSIWMQGTRDDCERYLYGR